MVSGLLCVRLGGGKHSNLGIMGVEGGWRQKQTSTPIGAWNCNFQPLLGNYDRQTDRLTNGQTGS